MEVEWADEEGDSQPLDEDDSVPAGSTLFIRPQVTPRWDPTLSTHALGHTPTGAPP